MRDAGGWCSCPMWFVALITNDELDVDVVNKIYELSKRCTLYNCHGKWRRFKLRLIKAKLL